MEPLEPLEPLEPPVAQEFVLPPRPAEVLRAAQREADAAARAAQAAQAVAQAKSDAYRLALTVLLELRGVDTTREVAVDVDFDARRVRVGPPERPA